MRHRLMKFAAALATAVPLAAPSAFAAYPDKPIQLVVPYSPGGGADGVSRVVAQRMSAALGQPVVVENRPGAGGTIGANHVAKAAADGYTALFVASHFAVDAALNKLPYDPEKDFVPISLVSIAPNILVVPPNAPYRTVAEFVAYARANPGKLSYASAGPGTAQQLAAEMLIDMAKLGMVQVTYKGGGPALIDVMGGHVSAYFTNVASGLAHINAGKLRALAVTSKERLPGLPNVPSFAESGYPEYEMLEWLGILVPRGTPAEAVQRLSAEVRAALADPQVREKLAQTGVQPVGGSGQDFARFIQAESKRLGELMRTINASGAKPVAATPR